MKQKKSEGMAQPKIGRPSIKTPELIDEMLLLFIEGKNMRDVCALPHMPQKQTLLKWLSEDAEFSARYARAKEVLMDAMAEEILEIADDVTKDREAFVGVNHVNRARLQIDTRKFLMSKLAPKKYGERLALDHSGSVEVKKVEVEIITKPKSE